ncbi:MAG: hypothetical protein JWR09_4862 [Mucilaginibacter sp.]|nr:hypothetical protein [Mucilaginibacter sp.]
MEQAEQRLQWHYLKYSCTNYWNTNGLKSKIAYRLFVLQAILLFSYLFCGPQGSPLQQRQKSPCRSYVVGHENPNAFTFRCILDDSKKKIYSSQFEMLFNMRYFKIKTT